MENVYYASVNMVNLHLETSVEEAASWADAGVELRKKLASSTTLAE